MKRDYRKDFRHSILFVGTEVEKPAYGMKTLFVDGVQDIENIMYYYAKQNANTSFLVQTQVLIPTNPIIGTNGNQ